MRNQGNAGRRILGVVPASNHPEWAGHSQSESRDVTDRLLVAVRKAARPWRLSFTFVWLGPRGGSGDRLDALPDSVPPQEGGAACTCRRARSYIRIMRGVAPGRMPIARSSTEAASRHRS